MKWFVYIAWLGVFTVQAQDYLVLQPSLQVGQDFPAVCADGNLFMKNGASAGPYYCAANVWISILGASSVPAGSLIFITSGTCSAGWSEATDLAGKTLFGTVAANGDVGATGGSDTVTPTGTNSAPAFTGSALGTHSHGVGTYAGAAASAGTPAGTNSTSTVTPLGTIAWPAGVPTFSGTPFSGVINHTHTVSVTDPGHTHTQAVNSGTTGGLSGYTPDTSTQTSTTSGYSTGSNTTGITASTSNPAGGVASITPAGTVAWPAGVPTLSGSSSTVGAQIFTGSALGNHSHSMSGSSEAVSAGTPAGTVAAPVFSGTQFDNRSAFVKVIFCRKT